MRSILIILFLLPLLCFSQSNPIITVDESATTKQVKLTVQRSELYKPPIINIGPSPYGNEVSSLWEEGDSTYFTYITLIYVPYEPDTIVIKAKDFLDQGGTIIDVGRNAGKTGVLVESDIVGFFNTGDWLKYNVNLTGKKKIKLRYSYGFTLTDRTLEIRKDSITGTLVASMPARPSGNWNTFIDHDIDINIDTKSTGPVNLFFIVKGPDNASAYWGNLDLIEFR
jgi:hypothetical protein